MTMTKPKLYELQVTVLDGVSKVMLQTVIERYYDIKNSQAHIQL